MLTMAVPWRTLAGLSGEPGRIPWLGPITPVSAHHLAVAASADPCCDWNVIVTDEDGRAITVSRIPRRRTRAVRGAGQGGGGPGLIGEVTVTVPRDMCSTPLGHDGSRRAAGLRGADRPISRDNATGTHRLDEILADALAAAARAMARANTQAAANINEGACAHADATPSYRVPPRMRAYVQARDRTCRSPTCRQPASRCDQDHTLPHHQGGKTCPCNLGGTCRIHHQLKQLPGWQLAQPEPGTFAWTTPAGLTYRVKPDRHPA
jgi:hypothetical protein